MKLKQPDTYKDILTIDGVEYPSVNGFVEVPDSKVHDGLYGFGFHRVEDVVVADVELTEKVVKVEILDKKK